jgi:hypothetical protein
MSGRNRKLGERRKDRVERKEERFILNLTRMSEETTAVFPEHFMEFCVHLTDENERTGFY